MSAGLVHFLFLGAFLFAAGALAVARQRSFAGAVAGLPLMFGGAGVDLVAVSRFATAWNAGKLLANLAYFKQEWRCHVTWRPALPGRLGGAVWR